MLPKPTDAELSILRVLWDRGPSTVRQVFDTLGREREVGYTTVLKLLQIMVDKGLATREEQDRLHIYRPSQSSSDTRDHLLRDLADKAFGGSAARLVMQALSTQPASTEELAEIRRLLEAAEQEPRP